MDLKALFQILHCDLVKPKLNLFMSIKAVSTFSGNLAPPCVKDRSGGTRRKPIRVCNVATIKQKHAKDGVLPFFCFGRVKPLSSYFVISSSSAAVAPSDPSALQASLEAMQATSFSATCQGEIIQIIQRKPETSLRRRFPLDPRDSQKLEMLSWRGSRVLSLQNRANRICGWTTGFCVGKKVHSQRWTCPDAKPTRCTSSYRISYQVSYHISYQIISWNYQIHHISDISYHSDTCWNHEQEEFGTANAPCRQSGRIWKMLVRSLAWLRECTQHRIFSVEPWIATFPRASQHTLVATTIHPIVPELDEKKIETRNLFF